MTRSHIVTTPEHLREVVDYFLQRDQFVFDVETRNPPGEPERHHDPAKHPNALNPRLNEVYWISMATYGLAVVIPMGHAHGALLEMVPAPMREGQKRTSKRVPRYGPPPPQMSPGEVFDILKPLFFDTSIRKWAHNAPFDFGSCAKYWGELPPGPYGDTVVLAHVLNENRSLRLIDLVKSEFKHAYEKIGKTLEGESFDRAASYSYMDSKYTWLWMQRNLPRLVDEQVEDLFWFLMDVLDVVLAMESVGIAVHYDKIKELDVLLRGEMTRLETFLFQEAGREFMLTAPADKGWFVYTVCGHEPYMYTAKTKQPSTAADAFTRFESDPRVKAMMEWDDMHKLHSTYVVNFLSYIHEGRLHASFKQAGTVTGRFSCVSGSTLLTTNRGVFRFDEYLPMRGDTVTTHMGRQMPVLRKIYKGKQEMLRVSFSDGNVLECTQEHRLLTPTGWRYVRDLSVGNEVHSSGGVEEVHAGQAEHQRSDLSVRGAGQTDAGAGCAAAGYELGKLPADRAREHAARAAQGRGGVAVLTVEDGSAEPDDRKEWFPTPWPQGGHSRRAWVLATQGGTEVRLRTPTGHGRGAGLEGTASVGGGAPHRRGQAEQLAGQPRGGHEGGASGRSWPTISVREVATMGTVGVWDIEVAGDHSYVTQGLIHHNCSEPNLQNVPRSDTEVGKKIRQLFWAGDPDHCLVVGDYSQIELRVLAHYSGEPVYVKAFNDGEDIHQATADGLGIPRTIGKNLNFAIPFGAGPTKIAAMAGISASAAKKHYQAHKKTYPKVWGWIDMTKKSARRTRPPSVTMLLGRKRRVPGVFAQDDDVRARSERQAVNAKIQGSAADIIQMAMVRIHDTLDPDMHLLLQVHDELVVSTPRAKVDKCVEIMREAMQGEEMQILRVPITANIDTGDDWAAAK